MLWDCMGRIGVGGGGGRYSLIVEAFITLSIGRNDEDTKTASCPYRYTT